MRAKKRAKLICFTLDNKRENHEKIAFLPQLVKSPFEKSKGKQQQQPFRCVTV